MIFGGCVGATPSSGPGPNVAFDPQAIAIRGLVIDDEFVPIEGVTITDAGCDRTAMTDSQGVFILGPLEEGEHPLTASKVGYQSVGIAVAVFDEPVEGIRFVLSAATSNVPYHETTNHVTFVNCASYNLVGGVPCTALPDYVIGGNTISPDESFSFRFKVPNDNLADLLIEVTWTPQAFGHDMSFWFQTPPGQPATAVRVKYFGMSGGAPLRGWVIADIENPSGDDGAIFDAEPNKVEYDALTAWNANNSTIPYHSFYFNHRAETWMTYFYNRPGSREFTALPDV
ncbi:MAG TPA: carboxypeptidase-like regulatory domain-containing protein [Candidatus Thermoplasmatota archaeon]